MAAATESNNKVILYGMWGSAYVKRVELALKLKGIPYEYIEEDLNNKSPSLLTYNPVHNKVPVLVHNGNPVAESFVILEYIDETWSTSTPKFLPQDPYKRAKVRFWADFIQHQLFEKLFEWVKTEGDAQLKAAKVVEDNLKVFEQGLKDDIFSCGESSNTLLPVITKESAGFLEIVMCSCFGPYDVQEEVLGVKIIDPARNPLVYSWLEAIKGIPEVKQVAPPREKLVALLQFIRENGLKSSVPI
ncbi:Glutathione S-transferase U9 [Linum perenne]